MHTFERTKDGQLKHSTDGEVRAIVPPEGWADYAKIWPDCQPVIDAMSGTKPATPANLGELARAADAAAVKAIAAAKEADAAAKVADDAAAAAAAARVAPVPVVLPGQAFPPM